jgi:hypothetical protein
MLLFLEKSVESGEVRGGSEASLIRDEIIGFDRAPL